MFKNRFMNDIVTDREIVTKSFPPKISDVFGSKKYECFLSDFQLDRIESLVNSYPKKEDQENKLPYQLRPSNMIKTIRFV